jgi:lysophospholipase L1-like esterase
MKLSRRFIIFSTFVFVVLGSSFFLNIFLYGQAKKFYIELNQVRLDPLGLSYYPENHKPTTDSNQIYTVFFGDSRAASWISPNISGYKFINRGINAQTSVQASERFDYHIRPLQPNIVVIQIGINDLKTISLFPDRKKLIVATCQSNIKRIVEETRKLGAVTIVTTIFPVGKVPLERKPFWSDGIDKSIQEVNAYIFTLAGERTFIFDTFSILADSNRMMMQKYSADELHLNKKGYAILNMKLVHLLNTIKQQVLKS